MKLGLISDIHGDPVALELAWSHLTVMGADRIVCAGDLVGYGPFPDRVVGVPPRAPDRRRSAATTTAGPWSAARASATSSAAALPAPRRSITCGRSRSTSWSCRTAGPSASSCTARPAPTWSSSTASSHRRRTSCATISPTSAATSSSSAIRTGRCGFAAPRGWSINPGSVVSMPVVDTSRTFALVDLDTLEPTFHDVESGRVVEVEPWH